MFEELFKAVKIFLFSILLLALLQVKYEGVTLERRALFSLRSSTLGQNIQDIAHGASLASARAYAWTKNLIHSSLNNETTESASEAQKATR